MTYKDMAAGLNGVATIFSDNYSDGYTSIFGTTDSEILDGLMVVRYGGKTMVPSVTSDTYITCVKALITLHIDGWLKIAETLAYEYNAIAPGNKTTTKTESVTGSNSNTNTTVNARKAFNDTEFGDDEKTDYSGSGDNSQTASTTETISSVSSVTEAIREEIQLRQRSFAMSVLDFLIHSITTDIY